jgi:anti-anti-sigma factor
MADEPTAAARLLRLPDEEGHPVVGLAGEMDCSSVEAVRRALAPIVDTQPGRVTIDLSELRFVDSSGLTMLMATAERTSVVLRNPTPIVRQLLEVTGLSAVLNLQR